MVHLVLGHLSVSSDSHYVIFSHQLLAKCQVREGEIEEPQIKNKEWRAGRDTVWWGLASNPLPLIGELELDRDRLHDLADSHPEASGPASLWAQQKTLSEAATTKCCVSVPRSKNRSSSQCVIPEKNRPFRERGPQHGTMETQSCSFNFSFPFRHHTDRSCQSNYLSREKWNVIKMFLALKVC